MTDQDPAKTDTLPNPDADAWQISPDDLIGGGSESEQEPQTLESMAGVLLDDRYMVFAHATSSSAVDPIFEKGLLVGDDEGGTNMDSHAIGLDTSAGIVGLKQQLDNHKHRGSDTTILLRVPLQFIDTQYHEGGDSIPAEQLGVFYQDRGEGWKGNDIGTYDTRCILGSYSPNTGMITLNPHYAADLDNEQDLHYMEEKYKQVVEKNRAEMEGIASRPLSISQAKPNSTPVEAVSPPPAIGDVPDVW